MAHVSVSKSVILSAPPPAVWTYISDFSGFAEWQPHIARVEMQADGVRKVFFNRGDTILDKVVSRDDDAMTFTYSVVPGQPTPLEDMDATFSVSAVGEGAKVAYAIAVKVPDEMEQPAIAGVTADIEGALTQLEGKFNV